MTVTWYTMRYTKRCAGCGRAISHLSIFTVQEAATETWCAACTRRLDAIACDLPLAHLARVVAAVRDGAGQLADRLGRLAAALYEAAECDATRAARLPAWMTTPRTIGASRAAPRSPVSGRRLRPVA